MRQHLSLSMGVVPILWAMGHLSGRGMKCGVCNCLPLEISGCAELTPPRNWLLTEGGTAKHSKVCGGLVPKECHTQGAIKMTHGESAKPLQTTSLRAGLPCGCFQ